MPSSWRASIRPIWIWLTPDWWVATCTAPSTERKRAQRTSIGRGDSSQILVGGRRPEMPGRIAPAGWAYTRGEWEHPRGRLGGLSPDLAHLRWRKCGIHRSFPQSFHSVAQSVDNFGAWGWCWPGNGRDTVARSRLRPGRPGWCTIGCCNHRECCPARTPGGGSACCARSGNVV